MTDEEIRKINDARVSKNERRVGENRRVCVCCRQGAIMPIVVPAVYSYIRPYPGRLGKQIQDFVESLGLSLGRDMKVEAGTSDADAARWIIRTPMHLLVLPFHLHRCPSGGVLDGIGVLQQLPEEEVLNGVTIVMPVRAFSWGSSFQRRTQALKAERAHLHAKLIVAHQDEISGASLASRIRRSLERNNVSLPRSSYPSIAPSSLPSPQSGFTRSSRIPASAQPSSGVKVAYGRDLGAGAKRTLVLPELPQDLAGSASFEKNAVSFEKTAVSFEKTATAHEKAAASHERTTAQSAKDSFRRAAEIGAKAREEAFGQRGSRRRTKA